MAMGKAADAIIYILYILLIILSFALLPEGGSTLFVEADGRDYAFSLSEDGLHEVEGAIGTTVIEISDGRARILSSPCPNQTCVQTGWSDTLCCLPNKVICISGERGDVDAISG